MFLKTFIFHPARGWKAPTEEKEEEASFSLVIPLCYVMCIAGMAIMKCVYDNLFIQVSNK
jgi:hypothetical protein